MAEDLMRCLGTFITEPCGLGDELTIWPRCVTAVGVDIPCECDLGCALPIEWLICCMEIKDFVVVPRLTG